MTHFDLAIIGSGSGNSVLSPELDGWRVAIIEDGIFGGTCLNVGCIPTKMFVYAADVADTVRRASRYGVDASIQDVRWPDIRDRVFGRIDPISAGGRDYRAHGATTTLFESTARFTGPRELSLATGERITAERIVIAAGSRAVVPPVVADSGVPYYTSDTIMRLDALPRRLAILGGGYIAAEFAHVFSALGVEVTVISRSAPLLRHLDTELAERFTGIASERWDVRLGAEVSALMRTEAGVRLELTDGTGLDADALLVAAGRVSNGSRLNAAAAGVELHPDGRVVVDEFQRTTAEGVWALGDVSSDYQLKHVANHEARVVAHNLAHPDDLVASDHRFVPSAVFTDPQLASVGLTEQQARSRGIDHVTAVQAYGDTAYGWAMEDTTSICKLIAEPASGRLLGAHLMGPQASTLIQPLIQAMSLGLDARELARSQYWIHPALSEVIENALLKLPFS
jgi:mycothione reductase